MTHLTNRLLFLVFVLIGCSTLSAQKMEGMASFYADRFDGLSTSTGETFRQNGYMAASMDLPWGTIVEVTNVSNGRKVQVRINDCGPHAKGRIIDLSRRAAQIENQMAFPMRVRGERLVELVQSGAAERAVMDRDRSRHCPCLPQSPDGLPPPRPGPSIIGSGRPAQPGCGFLRL